MHFVMWMQHLFAASLLLLTPIVEAHYDRRLKIFTSTERRTTWYQVNIIVLCVFAASAIALAYPVNIFLLPDHQAVALWLRAHPAILLGAVGLAVAYTCLSLGQGLRAAMNTPLRAKIAKAMRPLQFALPVTAIERRWWVLVSLSAGVCEETIYRGFVTHYFSGSLGASVQLGIVGAWLACSLFFGLAHSYQGVAGIVRTTLGGLMLGLIAILSGGLLLPIVLHFLFDLQMLWMYRPMSDEPDKAALLINGCEPSVL